MALSRNGGLGFFRGRGQVGGETRDWFGINKSPDLCAFFVYAALAGGLGQEAQAGAPSSSSTA